MNLEKRNLFLSFVLSNPQPATPFASSTRPQTTRHDAVSLAFLVNNLFNRVNISIAFSSVNIITYCYFCFSDA